MRRIETTVKMIGGATPFLAPTVAAITLGMEAPAGDRHRFPSEADFGVIPAPNRTQLRVATDRMAEDCNLCHRTGVPEGFAMGVASGIG
jgi:hypothetical protein